MIKSVTQILKNKYGLECQPGKKIKCPRCQHRTLSINRDNSLAKCFYPDCGICYRTNDEIHGIENPLPNMLDWIYRSCRNSLLKFKEESDQKNAYTYLIDRGIHPTVIKHSMLGAVPADSYGMLDEVRKTVEAWQKKVDYMEEEHKKVHPGRGRKPNNNELSDMKDVLERLRRLDDTLRNSFGPCAGWLCFFYTDEQHHITSVRLRNPYTKEIRYFKPFARAGAFGHTLSEFSQPLEFEGLEGKLIVVEGEFNQLQLQSLALRQLGDDEGDPSFIPCCAVGGVGNADFRTIAVISRKPVICYDNDEGKAGFGLVRNAQQHLTVEAMTTPDVDSDLDSFICGFNDDHTAAWDGVNALFKSRKTYYRDIEIVADCVYNIRREPKIKDVEIDRNVQNVVLPDLHGRGRFYQDGTYSYFFSDEQKRMVRIDPECTEYSLMLDRYGINASEKLFKHLVNSLHMEAIKQGSKTTVHQLSHYDRETSILYLHDGGDQIFRISPEEVERVDNGTDGVLFLSKSDIEPFEWVEGDYGSTTLLDEVLLDGMNWKDSILTVQEKRLLVKLYVYYIFFHAKTKPILLFVGEKGSGKSSTARKIGKILFGQKFDVTPLTSEIKDFDAAITNSTYVALDNADTAPKWLLDRLAIAATGGTIKKRQLYHTNKEVNFPIRCFLAITSRTPNFKRDDVADRLLVIKVERFEKFIPDGVLFQKIEKNRDRVMSEIICNLQRIVRIMRDKKDEPVSTDLRMADFADFCIKVAPVFGAEDQIHTLLKKVECEQLLFRMESNQTLNLLYRWADENTDKEIDATALHHALKLLAEKESVIFPYASNSDSFAQHLNNSLIRQSEGILEITSRKGHGGIKKYRITPKWKISADQGEKVKVAPVKLESGGEG